ncbi:MAG: hypothetical protein ACYTGN_14585 [Planctomycetota bacterium]
MIGERIFLAAGAAAVALLTTLAVSHRDYYTLPPEERPRHAEHDVLRPSGDLGLACAIVGSSLFLLNLTYLLRKRFAPAGRLGGLRTWMGFHVATGLVATALILLHSGFLLRSAPATLATGCLAVVVATGLIGRYLYGLVPRSLNGRELEREELRRRLDDHRDKLAARGLALDTLAPPRDVPGDIRGFASRLAGVLAGNRAVRAAYRALEAQVRKDPALRPLAAELLPVARRYCRDEQWLARYADLRGLMGSWRFLHRWLAIVMLAVAAFHIAIALEFGGLL